MSSVRGNYGRLLAATAGLLVAGVCLADSDPRPVSPQKLAKYWLVASDAIEATVPNSGVNMDKPSCASVAYVINANGVTSNIVLERVVPQGDLGKVAVSVVSNLRYAPAAENVGVIPVATRVVLPFNLPPVKGTAEERAKIEQYRAAVVAACEPPPPAPPAPPAK